MKYRVNLKNVLNQTIAKDYKNVPKKFKKCTIFFFFINYYCITMYNKYKIKKQSLLFSFNLFSLLLLNTVVVVYSYRKSSIGHLTRERLFLHHQSQESLQQNQKYI